ncbi:MAG: hypothetical protein LBR11_07435 [Deltaproteobacteria bacterium]|jgi:hypothetical protein|nr:hypothetical protein [Deltaproteobacteria bacterium]
MAKSVLTWKYRRSLVDNAKTPAETLKKVGRELMSQGYLAESAEFFRKAEDQAGLTDLLSQAVAEGDFFLYSLARQFLRLEPQEPELRRLAEVAEAAGLFLSQKRALDLLDSLQVGPTGPDLSPNSN